MRCRPFILLLAGASGCLRGGFEPWPTVEPALADGPPADLEAGADGSGGDQASADGGDPAGDAAGDPTPACTWTPFSTPTHLAVVNSGGHDFDPTLSTDGLELIWSSDRPGGDGGLDLYRARRAALGDNFGSVENLAILNSAQTEASPNLSADGLTLYFVSNQDGGDLVVWLARRPNLGAAFTAPVPAGGLLALLTAGGLEADPSGDELRLYLTMASLTDAKLWVAERANTADEFNEVRVIPEVDLPGEEFFASIRGDELELYFGYSEGGGSEIYVARRSHRDAPFGAPVPVVEVNSLNDDDPDISTDGRILTFASGRSGTVGASDLWMATRDCL